MARDSSMSLLLVLLVAAVAGARVPVDAAANTTLGELRVRHALLGRKPQMGWITWNHFYCGISEEVITETADALINTGLAKLGYKYVNIDD